MGISTPSSTALGWANFLYDYLSGSYPSGAVDGALEDALNDAQNGLNGAVVGGTIYFPPLSGNNPYPISGTHTITGSCALISTGANDTRFNFAPSGTPFNALQSAFIIEGANVTLQGFSLHYPDDTILSLDGDNVAAIQVVSTAGVVIEDVIIVNAYGGVDCVASSVVCERVQVYGTPGTSGNSLPQLPPYGFCAEPGDSESLAGLTMVIRDSKVDTGDTFNVSGGVVGYLLVPPYPEMTLDQAAPKNVKDAFRILTGASSVSTNTGILRVRNSSSEADDRVSVVEGGSVAQFTHLNDDRGNVSGIGSLFTQTFSGVGLLAGNHYGSGGNFGIEFGVSALDSTTGDEEPISALLSVIGCIASSSSIFLSMTASGSAVFNTVGTAQSGPSIEIGTLNAGPAAVVGGSLYTEGIHLSGGPGSANAPLLIEALATDAPLAIGGPVTLADSPPFNPAGVLTPAIPSLPAWTGTNDTGFDVVVYLTSMGIQITQIAVGGESTGITMTGAATYPVAVPAGQPLELTFNTTPNAFNFAWTWIAN